MNILFIFGTRPEAIKMAPLIKACQKRPNRFRVSVCVSAQHREMLDQVLSFFSITPDFDLAVMQENQSLFDVAARALTGLQSVVGQTPFDLILVQGDTTTAFIGALAGYYAKIKVGHVEAGLRSGNKYSPFPEEVNRLLVSRVADYHFAPTPEAVRNLRAEGIRENVWCVGNTVIDALHSGLQILRESGDGAIADHFQAVDFSKRVILITGHRRESFGEPFEAMCAAFGEIARMHPEVELVYPVHRNPNVNEPVRRTLQGCSNIHLMGPLDYPHLLWLMNKSFLVLTDSGGIQEEAPSLGKPVLVMREVTERMEGVAAGTARLIGTKRNAIVQAAHELLSDPTAYQSMANAVNPYGDGTASEQITAILETIGARENLK